MNNNQVMQLTEQDESILVILAHVVVGNIELNSAQKQELARLLEQLSPEAQDIAAALQGKSASQKAQKLAEELKEWAQQNEP